MNYDIKDGRRDEMIGVGERGVRIRVPEAWENDRSKRQQSQQESIISMRCSESRINSVIVTGET